MKGEHNQECNRTVCKNENAQFYNHSTRKYYCAACAILINDANRNDAMRMFGHDICTLQLTPLTFKDVNVNAQKDPTINTKKVRRAGGKLVNARTESKISRNQPCPCGSTVKYKHCCINK